MTDTIRSGGFTALNTYETQNKAPIEQQIDADAPETADAQKQALDDKQLVSSTTLSARAKEAGWNGNKTDKALDRYDLDHDDNFSSDEFDLLAASMEPGKAEGYQVENGDSLSGIAQSTGRPPEAWKELYAANKQTIGNDPNRIEPGQKLEKPPGWVIEDAKIPPDKPAKAGPAHKAQVEDTETLAQAQNALKQVPKDDPKRAQYEAKVDKLQHAYDKKWPVTKDQPAETPPAETPAETPPAEEPAAEAPAPDPEAKAAYDELLKDPTAAAGWDAAKLGKVQSYVEGEVKAQLETASDTTKTPAERAEAAASAKETAQRAYDAANDAGQFALANGVKDDLDAAAKADTAAKVATGDRGAVEQAIKAARDDDAQLKAIADALPAGDPRAEALAMIADGKVSKDVRKEVLNALQDQDDTRDDFADALQNSDGRVDDIKAIALVADYKAKSNDDADTTKEMEALAASLHALEGASEGVRKELVKGFDQDGNRGDFERAVDKMDSKEDVAALLAFAKHKDACGDGDFMGFNVIARLEPTLEHYESLHGYGERWEQVRNLIHDDRDNDGDLIEAGKKTKDLDAFKGLAKIAEATGKDNDIAAKLYQLSEGTLEDADEDTKKEFIKG